MLYTAVLVLGTLSIISRREVIVLTGRNFLKFNILFVALTMLILAISRTFSENWTAIILLLIVLVFSFLVRRKWFFFRYDPVSVASAVEDSLSKVLMPFGKSGQVYILGGGDTGQTIFRITGFFPKCAVASYQGQPTKKFEVFQNLLRKNFNGVFPRLVIRLK